MTDTPPLPAGLRRAAPHREARFGELLEAAVAATQGRVRWTRRSVTPDERVSAIRVMALSWPLPDRDDDDVAWDAALAGLAHKVVDRATGAATELAGPTTLICEDKPLRLLMTHNWAWMSRR